MGSYVTRSSVWNQHANSLFSVNVSRMSDAAPPAIRFSPVRPERAAARSCFVPCQQPLRTPRQAGLEHTQKSLTARTQQRTIRRLWVQVTRHQ